MQMLLRFLFLTLLLTVGLAQAPIADKAFNREFGSDGVVGSFRAHFTRDGAGLVWLQAMDHYYSLAAAKKPSHDGGDYLLLTANGLDHALQLLQVPRQEGFPVDPATATWIAEDIEGGVRFRLDLGNGLELEKVLRHEPERRGFGLEIALRNHGATLTGEMVLQLTGPVLTNIATGFFGTSAVSIAVPSEGDPLFVKPDATKVQTLAVDPKKLSFAGSTNRFFGAFLVPHDAAARDVLTGFEVDAMPPMAEDATAAHSSSRIRYGIKLAIPAKDQETRVGFDLYLGPKSYRVFATLPDPALFAPILDVDLNSPCCGAVTMPGGRPMAKALLWLLGKFHDLIGNWGVAIIMLTLLVRSLLAPLNFHMQKSMRVYSARMAKLKPKMDEIKARFADDKKGEQQAMIALQREHKLLPPLGGCLPILATMPVYIGLFTALRTAYDLRQQPFVSWIDDLSVSDALMQLPFWPHQLNLLPLLWIGLMLFLQFRQPLPTDPQQRQTMKIMRFMPMLFAVALYSYASALLVYMVTSILWSLIESSIIKRILGPVDPNVAAMTPTPM